MGQPARRIDGFDLGWCEETDQIMLVTDKGQLIRCPINDVRIAGRNTQGVTLFRTADDEHVVSVEHIGDAGAENTSDEDE